MVEDMARSHLSRHEELRYEYLLKNLEYLSSHEKQEFNYLYQKKQAGDLDRQPFSQSSNHDYDSYSDRVNQVEDGAKYWTDQGLPEYPKEKKSSFRRRRAQLGPVSPHQAVATNGIVGQETQKPMRQRKAKKQRRKGRVKRFFKLLALLVLLILAGMLYMFFKGVNDVSNGKTNYTAAVTEPFNGQDSPNGTNILILGSDQRVTQGSADARTDTIMVMNIGNSDGKIKLVSFMRDILVNIKGVSYNAYTNDQKLNVAFNIGGQDNNQGAELMRQTLKDNFDINIKYYVMVDFETFAEAIDTLFPNGVDIDAKFGTVDGQTVSSVEVPDDLNMQADGTVPTQTITVGKQKMDGRTLLNYARFRKDDDGDYGRTQRQQQVISALVKQIKDPTKLFTGSAAIGKIYALTSTNVSYPFLLKEGLSVITSGQEGIEQTTIPAEGDWIDDYDMYGGLGIAIDFDKYQAELKELGLR